MKDTSSGSRGDFIMPQFHLSDKHCHDGSADTVTQAMAVRRFPQLIVFYGANFWVVWLESCA